MKDFKGNSPFLSLRVLGNTEEVSQYTVLDDLESLTWVLFWTALGMKSREDKTGGRYNTLSKTEKKWIHRLTSSDHDVLYAGKFTISVEFKEILKVSTLQSECIFALSGLFTELFEFHIQVRGVLARILRLDGPHRTEDAGILLEEATKAHFDEYFAILDKFLDKGPPISFHPSGSRA